MKQHHGIALSLPRSLVAIIAIGLVGGMGSHYLGASHADTISSYHPYGAVDSCALVNGTTVIYGWVNDPEAPKGPNPQAKITVGNASQTVNSDISGYRDASINAYIHDNYHNQPTTGEYGFQAAFSSLYKGTAYHVTGLGINYGANGSDTGLSVNTTGSIDGYNAAPYFAGSNIPDACLNAVPASPPPPTNPSPPPGGGKSGGGTPKPTPPSVSPPGSDANAAVATGTSAATLTIPAEGASKIHVGYAISGGPTVTTDDQPVTADSTVVTLTNLGAQTDYTFQIVRTNTGGASSTSPATNFTTRGYIISLLFTDAKKKPVGGISASINDADNSSGKSDKNGKLVFAGLTDGQYTVAYTYKGAARTVDIDTSSYTGSQVSSTGTPNVLTLSSTINVDKIVAKPGQPVTKKRSGVGTVLLVLFILALLGGAGWWLLRFLKRRQAASAYSADTLPLPPAAPPTPTPIPLVSPLDHQASPVSPPTQHSGKHHQPAAEPLPDHAGESLRDMVLESMRAQGNHPIAGLPLVPGGIQPASAVPDQLSGGLQAPPATHAPHADPHPSAPPAAHTQSATHQPHPPKPADDDTSLTIDHGK